ncbi:MAG TPA: hypothetical protein VFF51_05745 [Candidatus Methylomirabilis sp.]|nr:hypothetical protein [Candidatus Methylomirabilis sp.]
MARDAVHTRQGQGARPQVFRTDGWWIQPAVTVLGLGTFIVYSTWAAFQNGFYFADPYLSPFYSPCIAANCEHLTVQLVGSWWTWSPAFLILWAPGIFRLTCYYYRKAYYRSFWWAPPACAMPDARRGYDGETSFPLIFQNIHRYTFYVAVLFIGILTWDALLALRFPDGFGIGVGTIVLWTNVVLLALYTFSCHSCRHLCGGHVDIFSGAPTRYRIWHRLSRLNERHALFAWLSLTSVGLADLYVRLVAMGIIRDVRLL